MDTLSPQTVPLDALDSQSDEALRTVIMRAREILAARETDRQKQAVSEIRRIAKAHGLTVCVGKRARRRGRPPKSHSAT